MKFAIFVLLAVVAMSASAANLSLVPSAVYETNTYWQAVDVDNYDGAMITSVFVSPLFNVSNAKSYAGWTTNFNSTSIVWSNGTIEPNVRSAFFEYLTTAPVVLNDTVYSFNVFLDSNASTLEFTVLNDATPPVISSVLPTGYALANNPSQPVKVVAYDNETAVSSVAYTWNDCIGSDLAAILSGNGDNYTGFANFSLFSEGSRVCFNVKAVNVPGESSNLSGELLFDGTSPVVSLISPTNFATEVTNVTFAAIDNMAQVLDCRVNFDGVELERLNVTNSTITTVTENLAGFDEGNRVLSVSCSDLVGLSSAQNVSVVLDKYPPVISLDAPVLIPRNVARNISANVTDTISLAGVNATFDGALLALSNSGSEYKGVVVSSNLGPKVLEFNARDSVGHSLTSSTTVTIVPAHQLSLQLSPGTALPREIVSVSGSIIADGSLVQDTVVVQTPAGEYTLNLSANNSFELAFEAPEQEGQYNVVASYADLGYNYTALVQFSVAEQQQQAEIIRGSSGIGADAWRTNGYVKPDEEQSEESLDETVEAPPVESPDAPVYTPLAPEEPREALSPKATGLFNLNTTIKWAAIALALGLLGSLGVYAYSKRKPDDGGIDWKGYFD